MKTYHYYNDDKSISFNVITDGINETKEEFLVESPNVPFEAISNGADFLVSPTTEYRLKEAGIKADLHLDIVYENIKVLTAEEKAFIKGQQSMKLQKKGVEMLLSEIEIEVKPDEGYSGISELKVTHAPVEEITKETITTNGNHTITPSEGFDATCQAVVKVDVHPTTKLVDTLTTNGKHVYGKEYNGAEINVNVQPKLQERNVKIEANGTQTIAVDSGFDGISKITIEVAVPTQTQTE